MRTSPTVTRASIPWILAGILAGALLLSRACPGPGPSEDPETLRLRTDILAARAEAEGWRQTLVAVSTDLEGQLMATRDSVGLLGAEKATLAREVRALGGQLLVLADMYAEVRGQIDAQATEHRASATAAVDSVTAPLDDGLLEGTVTYRPPTNAFQLDYVARMALVLGVAATPDGRALLTARGTDPRVRLEYGAVYYQPLAPVRVCSIGTRLEWGAWGVGVGFAGGLITALVVP